MEVNMAEKQVPQTKVVEARHNLNSAIRNAMEFWWSIIECALPYCSRRFRVCVLCPY
jgi:hypothetical protein